MRARENPRHYVADCRADWSERDFLASGEQAVAQYILNDMVNICQGRDPKQMRVLELGCGAGRVTRALGGLFGEVHAVDVSSEMVELARRAVDGMSNVSICLNNGTDLSALPPVAFDFAFSCCVFHHIPSKAVIENYIREVGLRLRPGALFKFEVQGYLGMQTSEADTWLGAPMGDAEMVEIAGRCGFEPRHRVGAGEERFWLWFFRNPSGD